MGLADGIFMINIKKKFFAFFTAIYIYIFLHSFFSSKSILFSGLFKKNISLTHNLTKSDLGRRKGTDGFFITTAVNMRHPLGFSIGG